MHRINRKEARPFLLPLLPRVLTDKSRITALFMAVQDYAENTDTDPIHRRDAACSACDEFESEAHAFGTTDADRILGELARQLKSAVASHFDSLEAGKRPALTFSPIAKKYPLGRLDESIVFKIRIMNNGTGPARDLRLDEVISDDYLTVQTSSIELGTIQAGASFILDILATVRAPSSEAKLLAQLSWTEPGSRTEETREFLVAAQRDDVAWDKAESTEPYSLDAITTGSDLIGRKEELIRLLRLANSKNVGSGFIYGQKRVGKTSLANAVVESLESSGDPWVVISKGSGDYVGIDASSTLQTLGEVLVQAMKDRIPGLANVPHLDFTKGLAPLSTFVDQALKAKEDLRLLFVLDEFDELPSELVKRSDVSTSLFQPLRQISSKARCGFLLVGGENMQRIMNDQGERLNKFRPIEVDYFSRSDDWGDFTELIRKPVQHWLTISEAALDELFTCCAGNPYFAKLLASQLFADMMKGRSSDASEVDVATAIDHALNSQVGANSFAHFWTDGLEASDGAEEVRIIRRSVLIAAGRAFRRDASATTETIWEECSRNAGFTFGEQRFRRTLQDFIGRKVMVEDDHGYITPKIPLFQRWLRDKGVRQLLGDSREWDHVQSRLQEEEELRVTENEIANLCKKLDRFRFRGRPIEPTAIRKWLMQFDGAQDQRLMFKLLFEINVYDEDRVRGKMKEAFGIVTRNVRTVIEAGHFKRSDVLVSSLDDSAAKAGLTYCRLFAGENQIFAESVQTLDSIGRRLDEKQGVRTLVLVDNFSGTGRTLVGGLEREVELLGRVNSAGIRIVVVVVAGFAEARARIERFIKQRRLEADVHFCDEFGPEHKAFPEESRLFHDPSERGRAKQIAETKGVALEPKQPLGYKDTQSLVVFYDSCPNNTLPILWSQNSGWSPLFPRL